MFLLTPPSQGLYFASILYRRDLITCDEILNFWGQKFNDNSDTTHIFEIDYTNLFDYYQKEMGSGLQRFFIFSDKSFGPREDLAPLKAWAQDFEKKHLQFSNDNISKRKVNIDIGLLTLENMVLATSKNFVHRIYLNSGVFADLNLIYKDKSYRPLSWTYPEYKLPQMIQKFNSLRKIFFK